MLQEYFAHLITQLFQPKQKYSLNAILFLYKRVLTALVDTGQSRDKGIFSFTESTQSSFFFTVPLYFHEPYFYGLHCNLQFRTRCLAFGTSNLVWNYLFLLSFLDEWNHSTIALEGFPFVSVLFSLCLLSQ